MIKSNPSTWVKTLHDVEVYKNCFITSIKNYETKEVITWEISNRRNDIIEICNFYKNYKNFIISFNGRHYDNIIIKAVRKYQYLDKDELLLKLKEISDNVITGNYDYKDKDYNKFTWWIDIDFMCYWSKNLRISKQISLKSLAIQIGWDEIEELPYHPNTILKDNQIDRLIRYNVRNDLGILDRLVEVFEGKSDIPLGNLGTIQLRADATKDYGIDMWSYDAPKIAATVLSLDYCNKTETDFKYFKQQKFNKEKFQFKDLFENIHFEFTTEIFKSIYNKWMNSYDTFSETFVAHTKDNLNGIKISAGIGGLHSKQEDQIFEEDDNNVIYDTDIALNWRN